MILNKVPNRLHIINPSYKDYLNFVKLYTNKVYHYYNIFLSYDDIVKNTSELFNTKSIIKEISDISEVYVKKHPKSYKPKINIFILTLDYSRHHNPWWRNRTIYTIEMIMNKILGSNNSYCNYHIESCRYYTTEHGNYRYSIYKEGIFKQNNCRILVIKSDTRTGDDETLYDSIYIRIKESMKRIQEMSIYGVQQISNFKPNILKTQKEDD